MREYIIHWPSLPYFDIDFFFLGIIYKIQKVRSERKGKKKKEKKLQH